MITTDNSRKFIGYLRDKLQFSIACLVASESPDLEPLISNLREHLETLRQASENINDPNKSFDYIQLIAVIKRFSAVLNQASVNLDPTLVQHITNSFYAAENTGKFREICQLFDFKPEIFCPSKTDSNNSPAEGNKAAIAKLTHFLGSVQRKYAANDLDEFIGYLQDKIENSIAVLETLDSLASKSLIGKLYSSLEQLEQLSRVIKRFKIRFRAGSRLVPEGVSYLDKLDFTCLISAVECFSKALKEIANNSLSSFDSRLMQCMVDAFYATSNKTISIETNEIRKTGNFEGVCQLFGLNSEDFHTSITENDQAIANFPGFLDRVQQVIKLDRFVSQLNSEILYFLKIYRDKREQEIEEQIAGQPKKQLERFLKKKEYKEQLKEATKKELDSDNKWLLIKEAIGQIDKLEKQYENFEDGLQIYEEIVKALTVESNKAQDCGLSKLARVFNDLQNRIAKTLAEEYPNAPATKNVIKAINNRLLEQTCLLFGKYKENYERSNRYFYKEIRIENLLEQIKKCQQPEDYHRWIILFEAWVKNPNLLSKLTLDHELRNTLKKTLRQMKSHCSFFKKPVPSDADERKAILEPFLNELLTGFGDQQIFADKEKEFSKLFKETIKAGLASSYETESPSINPSDPITAGVFLLIGHMPAWISIVLRIVLATFIRPIINFFSGKLKTVSVSDKSMAFRGEDKELPEKLAEELMERYKSCLPELKNKEDAKRVAQYAVATISQHYIANKGKLDGKNIEEKVQVLADQLLFSEKVPSNVAHKDDGFKQATQEISQFFSNRGVVAGKEISITRSTYRAITVNADSNFKNPTPIVINRLPDTTTKGTETRVTLRDKIDKKAEKVEKLENELSYLDKGPLPAKQGSREKLAGKIDKKRAQLNALRLYRQKTLEGERQPEGDSQQNNLPAPNP